MRNRLITLATVVALGATASLVGPAQAATTEECASLIGDLRTDTADEATTPSLTDRSRAGLVTKAEAALTKLEAGKVDDAAAKLADYDASLHALRGARKPKVDDADFALLDGEVHAAASCLADLTV